MADIVQQDKNGRWRVGRGRASYATQEEAERVLHGYQAASGLSIRGQKRKKLSDMRSKDSSA